VKGVEREPASTGHPDTRLLLPLHTMIKQNLSSYLCIRIKIIIATLQKDNLGEKKITEAIKS
jgi:hypothetical protein